MARVSDKDIFSNVAVDVEAWADRISSSKGFNFPDTIAVVQHSFNNHCTKASRNPLAKRNVKLHSRCLKEAIKYLIETCTADAKSLDNLNQYVPKHSYKNN